MNTAMSLDALKTSHPIDVKVNHPSEIREIFDSIFMIKEDVFYVCLKIL